MKTPVGLTHLKLKHLQFLRLLAEERHLGRAAERVSLSQPAASRLLQDLEKVFGRPLFERGRYGVRALPDATSVLRFARTVDAETEWLGETLVGRHVRLPAVRIGTLPTMPCVLSSAVERYKDLWPEGDVRIRQATLDVLLPQLLEGHLDLVVGRLDPLLLKPPLGFTRLSRERLLVVAHRLHPLQGERHVSPAQLREQPWVAPLSGSSLYAYFTALFDGLPLPNDLIECASPLTAWQFLQTGRRLALVSEGALVTPGRERLRPLNFELEVFPSPIGLYQVLPSSRTSAANEFSRLLLEPPPADA